MASFRILACFLAAILAGLAQAYSAQPTSVPSSLQIKSKLSRRSLFGAGAAVFGGSLAALSNPPPATAAAGDDKFQKNEFNSLETYLYTILRVREATAQESRLIKTGKFKDIQRANVKLAVRFMLNNYRLSDNVVAAASFLDGQRSFQAGQDGQKAVQNLVTILEYFDSAGVENIKVGGDSMAGKEKIVLSGLEATQRSLDDFISYFPKDAVQTVRASHSVLTIQNSSFLNVISKFSFPIAHAYFSLPFFPSFHWSCFLMTGT